MNLKHFFYATSIVLASNLGTCMAQISTTCSNDAKCTEQTGADGILKNRLFPKIEVPTTSLIIVDLKGDKIEGQVAACGLQGIINRTSKEKIYVINTLCVDNHGGWNNKPGEGKQTQVGRLMLRELFSTTPQTELKLDAKQINPGFMALLKKNKSVVKGIIIWDPALEEATIEAATTIAGQTDGLIVSPELAEQIKGYKFPVIEDLRGKFKTNIECLDWLKAKYFKTANHQIAFTWSHMTTNPENSWGAANKDYVVANRLFTYFLDITKHDECAYYETVVKDYPAGTPIFGWTDELRADKLFAEYGYFMVPYISVENLTIQSSYPSVCGKQLAPKAYPIENNAVYIACFVPDGDNLLHTMVYKPNTICNSANYGKYPTTWILNPAIVDLAPLLYNWYLKKSDTQEMAGMMGDGSPATDRYEGFNFYCEWAKHYIKQAGFRTMKQMVDAEAVAWRVQPYVMNSGYAGTDWRGAGPYEYHMDNNTFHIGTLHITEKGQLDEALKNAPKDQPLFLSIFCGTAVDDVPTKIKDLADRLNARNDGKKYIFVRSMDLAATYRAWKGLPIE